MLWVILLGFVRYSQYVVQKKKRKEIIVIKAFYLCMTADIIIITIHAFQIDLTTKALNMINSSSARQLYQVCIALKHGCFDRKHSQGRTI